MTRFMKRGYQVPNSAQPGRRSASPFYHCTSRSKEGNHDDLNEDPQRLLSNQMSFATSAIESRKLIVN